MLTVKHLSMHISYKYVHSFPEYPTFQPTTRTSLTMSEDAPRPHFLSQDEYFRTRLSFSLTASEIPHNTVCSICVEECSPNNNDAVVRGLACQNCYFHTECIKTWFTSTDQKRGTCPNDRRELFNPNPIDVARFNSPAPQSMPQVPPGHSLHYSLVYDFIDSKLDDIDRFREAWNECTRGDGEDCWHDSLCHFFASAQGPHILQANLRKLCMALQDTSLPNDMLEALQESLNWTDRFLNRLRGPRDLYVRLATHDLRLACVSLTKRLSSLTLFPEATWRNLDLCAKGLGLDVVRLGQWCQAPHHIPPKMQDSLLSEARSRNVLGGLTLSGRPEDLTWWEYSAKMMARALTLLDRVPQVDYPYDKRLDGQEWNVSQEVFEEVLRGLFEKFFTDDFQRNRYGHPCACTRPGEVQPYCPDAIRGRFSVLARGGAHLELRSVDEFVPGYV